ncbi:alpha/beta hydrolase [Luteococcus sp. Sow4_B9]|uniref:alpha/beta hydrolase n=1 Tax=Luteococcus sp. Sow4_B9 TaxID=3438792 RepID=UPI003F9697F5
MNTRSALAGLGLGGLGIGGLGVLAGAAAAAHQISGPQRPALDYGMSPFEVGVDAVDVTFTAADGTRLAGWWLGREDAERVVVISHGHRGSKADMLGIGPGLWRAGNSVLLYDFRGNGESADGPQSLAHYEQLDLVAAIDLAAGLAPGLPISLVGFSMGAATSILVAAQDARIESVVADSPFADMHGVIAAAARGLHLPPVPLVSLVDRVTSLRYGYRFADVAPIDVVEKIAPRPLLLVHCSDDHVIPVEHSRRLADAAGPSAHLEIVDGLDHCGAYFADRPGYIARVADFLRR